MSYTYRLNLSGETLNDATTLAVSPYVMKAARDCLDRTFSRLARSFKTDFCRLKSIELTSFEESAMNMMSVPKVGGAPIKRYSIFILSAKETMDDSVICVFGTMKTFITSHIHHQQNPSSLFEEYM